MELALYLIVFFLVVFMVFLFTVLLFPEWVGITGKKAKEINEKNRGDGSPQGGG